MKKLTNNLIVIPVPKDAENPTMSNHCIGFKSKQWVGLRDTNDWCLVELGLGGGKDYTVVGLIDKDNCDFDCSFGFVSEWLNKEGTVIYYEDYSGGKEYFLNPFDSLKSLVEKETEYLFENNLQEPKRENFLTNGICRTDDLTAALKEFNEAQSRVVEKLLILREV